MHSRGICLPFTPPAGCPHSHCQPGGRSTQWYRRAGAGAWGPIRLRTPAPDHGPCHASWCLELTWWVRPSLPAFCSPAVGGMGGPLVLGGAPAGCPLGLLHSHLGLGGLCFLLCLSWPPHFREGPLLGTLVTRGPTLLTPLPSAHSTLARPPSLAGPGCLPGHRTRPVNLTASGAVAGLVGAGAAP